MTQEFVLSVTPVQDDKYLIRTEHDRMSPGVPLAEEILTWEIDAWMQQAAALMNDPLVGLLRSGTVSEGQVLLSTELSSLSALGRQLYNALFQGSIRDSWIAAQGIAQNQQDILRLRLGLKDDRTMRLPWEVLHAIDRPLATGTDVVFSRYNAANLLPHVPAGVMGQPLRILMVLSAPTDQDRLQLHDEAEHLKAELAHDRTVEHAPDIELTILEQPGREQLTQSLEQGNYDILHYAGHSGWGAAGGDLYLVNPKTGLTEPLSGEDLAGLLVNNGVRMAVFNSCRGVQAATAEPGSALDNLADALFRRGIPAILAMAERIPDDVALILSRLFYRNLKQGYPIDLSLNRARQGLLSSYGSNQLYWALPILYLHPDFDGFLHRGPSQGAIDPLSVLDSSLLDFKGMSVDDLPMDDLPMDDFEPVLDPNLDPDYGTDKAAIADLMKGLDASGFDPGVAGVVQPMSPVDDLLQLGQRMQASGDLTGAIDAYGQALKLDGNNPVLYDALGTAFQAYGNLPEAVSSYRMAIQLDPSLTIAQTHLDDLLNGTATGAAAQAGMTSPPPAQLNQFGSGNAKPQSSVSPWRNPAAAAIAALAAVGLGVGVYSLNQKSPFLPTNDPSANSSVVKNDKDAQALVGIATQGFSKNEESKSAAAIETLLNSGQLIQAEEALKAASAKQQTITAIAYLRGRLSWQFAQQKVGNHSFQDARRYWSGVVDQDARNPKYQNALGSAFYVEKDYPRAMDAWNQTQAILGKGDRSVERSTAEAGLAMLYWQMSQKNSKDAPRLKTEAIKLRDGILKDQASSFSEEALGKNWLWTETMIQDWKQVRSLK